MSFILTKEQKMIIQLAKTFAETELAPIADEIYSGNCSEGR